LSEQDLQEASDGTQNGRGERSARRPTIAQVAARASVSRQTVSNVINAPQRVRQDTRRRVEQVIAELGYRPHRFAQGLRTGRSNLIALGFRTAAAERSLILDAFFHALTAQTQARGYRVVLATSDDDESEIDAYEDLLGRYDIDALILTGTHVDDSRLAWLSERQVPFVSFGRPWRAGATHAWVDVDGASGVRDGTFHLIERGHRRIAFVGWPDGSGVGEDRRSGWEQACRTSGLATEGLLRQAQESMEQGRAAAADLLDGQDPPTAIVCVSDVVALGAWIEVTARGRQPGRDVGIVGFDNSPTAAVVGLSSLMQPLAAVARACLDCLQSMLSGADSSSEAPPRQVLLPPHLVVRKSSDYCPTTETNHVSPRR
jgi:DNA-binding LacI/PurR family transcriptional regulator